MQDIAVLFVKLHEVLVRSFLQPAKALCMAAWLSSLSTPPPSFVSSTHLLRVHSVLSSRSLMNKLNYIEASFDSWGAQPVTDLQQHFLPLRKGEKCTLSPAVQLALSPHHCPLIWSTFHQFINKVVVIDSAESLAKVKIYDISFSTLTGQTSDFVVEG